MDGKKKDGDDGKVTLTEEELTFKLKIKVSASAVTKKRTQLLTYMKKIDNLHIVKQTLEEYEELFSEYRQIAEEYPVVLESEENKIKEEKKLAERETEFIQTQKTVNKWIIEAEEKISEDAGKIAPSEISRASSRGSNASARSSLRLKAKSKLAAINVNRKSIEKEQEIEKIRALLERQQLELNRQQLEQQLEQNRQQLDQKQKERELEKAIQQLELEKEFDLSTAIVELCEQEELQLSGVRQSTVEDTQVKVSKQAKVEPKATINPTRAIHDYNIEMNTASPMNIQTKAQPSASSYSHTESETMLRHVTSALLLPHPEIVKFTGELMVFPAFLSAFHSRIVPHLKNDNDRLYFLFQHLEGDPKDLIESCMYLSPIEGYNKAISLLKAEYGDKYKISMAYINKLLTWPVIKTNDAKGLKALVLYITKCNAVMHSLEYMDVLHHAPNLQAVIQKLPEYLQNKWRDNVLAVESCSNTNKITFDHLTVFLQRASKAMQHPIFGKDALNVTSTVNCATCTSYTVAKSSEIKPLADHSMCPKCKMSHALDLCPEFNQMSLEERQIFVKQNYLCFGCFGYGHIARECANRKKCSKCGKLHPTVLHDEEYGRPEREINGGACNMLLDTVLQTILPVKLYVKGQSKFVKTYAFFDSGSTGCFITESLKEKLCVQGTPVTLKMQTMNGKSYVQTSSVSDIIMCDLHGQNAVILPKLYSRQDMPVSHDQIPKPDVLMNCPHLQEIVKDLPAFDKSLEIGLLIGNNCPLALQPFHVVAPTKGDGPCAILYRHGWSVNGPLKVQVEGDSVSCHRIMLQELERMTECRTTMFEKDFTEYDTGKLPNETVPSREDFKLKDIMCKNTKFTDGKLELPMPFRVTGEKLISNKSQAVVQARWQKRKLSTNGKYYKEYVNFMLLVLLFLFVQRITFGNEHKALQNGECVSASSSIYKLDPYVCDESTGLLKVGGRAPRLNAADMEDETIHPILLPVMLIRFRQGKVAMMGDIGQMFYQVKVPKEQHRYLRFLWWPDGNLKCDIQEYSMAVHTFGAICSPSGQRSKGQKYPDPYIDWCCL